jgi:hypothetical protein
MAPMKVDVSTVLDCSAAKVWSEVQKSALLLHVIWPLETVAPGAKSALSRVRFRDYSDRRQRT